MTERRQQWIEEMEAEYQQLTQQLEQFTAIDEKRKQLAAALRALKGEKGVKGRPSANPTKGPSLEDLLRENPGLTAKALAAIVGVSDVTVVNRIAKLQQAGVRIITQRVRGETGYPATVYSIEERPPANGRKLSATDTVKGLLLANPHGVEMAAIQAELRAFGKSGKNLGYPELLQLKRQGHTITKRAVQGGPALYKLGK